MKKLDFPLIADCLFYSVCAGALSLCILRYYRVSLGWSAALALLFALATGGILFLLLHTKHRKLRLSKKEAEEKNALLFHLALERPERVRALLLAAFREDEKDAHCEGDELRVDGVTTVPMFSMQPVSADDIAKLIRFTAKNPFRSPVTPFRRNRNRFYPLSGSRRSAAKKYTRCASGRTVFPNG